MIRKNKFFFIAVFFLTLISGCMMSPIRTEFLLLGSDITLKNSDPEQVKMIIFNSSNKFLFGLDMTGRINIKIDGKGIGGLDIGEYVQTTIPKGRHKIELVRLDLAYIISEYNFKTTNDPLIVEVWASAAYTSNDYRILSDLPADFLNNFKPYKPVE